jgi:mono/diheme cytochrome c family protein
MNRSAIAALVLGLLLPLSTPRAQGDAAAGRKLAVLHCARCHVVGDHNPYGGIGSTPSFQLLARRADYLERFQTFFERRPHPVYVRVPGTPRLTDLPSPVAEFTVTPDNIEDLIAFVETLKVK